MLNHPQEQAHAATHSPGCSLACRARPPAPQALCTGPAPGQGQGDYQREMSEDSRGLTAAGRPPASRGTAIRLWEFSLLAERVLLGLRGCPGRRNSSVKTRTVWGKLELMAILLMGHCPLSPSWSARENRDRPISTSSRLSRTPGAGHPLPPAT